MHYIKDINKLNLKELNESMLILENIFDLQTYTKKNKAELNEAIRVLTKEAQNKYDRIYKGMYKKYKKFYDELELDPIYIYSGSNDSEILDLMVFLINLTSEEEITKGMLKKQIRQIAPFEFAVNVDLVNVEDKNDKLKGIVAFVVVPDNTFLNRWLFVNNYKYITSSILNHPLWSKIEYLILLLHELIEAEESEIDKRKNHYTGNMFLNFKNRNVQISQHHSVIVLAKEAVILNRFKHIKALRALRELRYTEWKAIKAETGVDLSTLTELDDKTIKKLLKMKKSIIKLDGEEEEGVQLNYDDIKVVPIKGFVKNVTSFAKNKIAKNFKSLFKSFFKSQK